MKKLFSLLVVCVLALTACAKFDAPDTTTPAATETPLPPTATDAPEQQECVTQRPMVLWEAQGPELEQTLACIDALSDHWWEGTAPALRWESSDPQHGDQVLLLTADGQVGIGCCEGLFLPLRLLPYQLALWEDMQARFAPFDVAEGAETLTFTGQGTVTSPAWERALQTWSRTLWGQLYTGHVCASCGTVLSWRFMESNASGSVDTSVTLIVTEIGRVTLIPLAPGDDDDPSSSAETLWLTTGEWEQFDRWLYAYAPADFELGQFSGRGTQPMDAETSLALAAWVDNVYNRFNR